MYGGVGRAEDVYCVWVIADVIANPFTMGQYSVPASHQTNPIDRHATSLLSLACFLSSSCCPVF